MTVLDAVDLKTRSNGLNKVEPAENGQPRGSRCRPVLQRQQRQSSEETTESGRSIGNVHFKEDPEYFEDSKAVRVGIYDPVKNVVSEPNNKEYNSPSKRQGIAKSIYAILQSVTETESDAIVI